MKREWHLNKQSSKDDIEISYDSSKGLALFKIPRGAEEFKIQRGESTMEFVLLKKAGRANSSWENRVNIGYASWIIVAGKPEGSSNFWTRTDFKAEGNGIFGGKLTVSSNASFARNLHVTSRATVAGLNITSASTLHAVVVTSNLTLGSQLVSQGATDGSGYKTLRVPSGS